MPPRRCKVLDGGTGHLLKAKGVERLVTDVQYDQLFLAGCLANLHRPEIVQDVHREYIAAGVDVITCNNFACTTHSLSKIGKADEAEHMIAAAARLARDAANQAERPVQVAGSLPPLQESYQTEGLPSQQALQDEYQRIAQALTPSVDLLLCETLSSVSEGVAAGAAASQSGKPWWISWSLADTEGARLRSGEPLKDAVSAVLGLPGLQAVLVNCCAPQAVTAAMPHLAQSAAAIGVEFGGYANGFKTTTSEWLAESGTLPAGLITHTDGIYDADGVIFPEAYAAHAVRWHSMGASIVGGCCGVGPAHMASVHRELHGGRT